LRPAGIARWNQIDAEYIGVDHLSMSAYRHLITLLFEVAPKMRTLRGYGHYEVYVEPAFSEVMAPTLKWFQEYMPA